MAITPMDIHNKEFSRSIRGYSADEVDQYLDQIVEEFERLYKENLEAKDRISMLGDQISQYKTIENTLKETLVTAQKTAIDVSNSAQKQAELIIKEAEERAKRIIEGANNQVIEAKKELQEYKKQVEIFKTRTRSLFETQLELLREEVSAPQNSPSTNFIEK